MKTIIFLGDSITAADRIISGNPLGMGYVNIFSESLNKSAQDWYIFNKAVDGYKTEQVAARLHSDCIAFHPDYVSILVGVNDIGKIAQSDVSEQEKLYMLEDSIRSYHEMLFDLSRETSARVITLEPFILPAGEEYQTWVPWQQKMAKNIKKLARNYGASFIPLQEPLLEKVSELGHKTVTADGIHLTFQGQQILADIIKEAFSL